MHIKHGYRKESEGAIKCRFCPRKYKNRPDCEIHMKENHDYDAVALRKNEREEKKIRKLEETRLTKEAKQKEREEARIKAEEARLSMEAKKKEREEISRIKAEEARLTKEAKQKEQEEEKIEKKRKREVEAETAKTEKEAKRQKRQAIPFDFTRDFLTQRDAVYCGKCNKVFTSIETRDRHELRHGDPKNFICGKCDKKFKKMDNKDFHEAHCRKKDAQSARDVSADDDENDDEVYSVIQSSLGGASKLYRLKFAKGIRNLFSRLEKAMAEASD